MTETTNDPHILKTLVCLERQNQDNMPEENITYRKKLSRRYGLVFYKDSIIVPKKPADNGDKPATHGPSRH